MGSKFHHTHVRSDDPTAVADALCKRALANDFSLAAEGQPCDYDVVVATNPASPGWTSIYNPFGQFTWELSDELTTYVVELEIFDSDVLYARLSNEGCEVDVFCSKPDYTDAPARAVKGQPKRWDSLCVSGKSWRDVQRVFKSAVENPELALVELGKVIGLDGRSLYPDHIDPAGPDVRRLRFRNPPSARRRILTCPPVAKFHAEGELALSMSAGARASGVVVRSEGGGANGVEIAFGGTAITSSLVAIEAVDYRNARGTLTARDSAGLVASFTESGFPAASGLVNDEQTEPEVADHWPTVQVGFTINPLRSGEGELELSFMPTDPGGVACTGRWLIRVTD